MEGSSQIDDGCRNCKELKKKIAELELQRRIYSTELEAELKKKSVPTEKSASEELKQLERYKALYLTSSDAITTIEPPDWKFTSGNPSAVKLFGAKDEKEFISFAPYDLSPETQPDGRKSNEKAKEMIEKALKNGSNLFQWTHKKYKGQDFPASVLLTKMTIDGKDILQTTVRDISKQVEIEKALKNQREEQQIILDSIPAWVFYKDKENRFIRVNDAFCKVLGKTKKDLEGKSCFDLFPKDQADAFLKDDLEVIESGKPKTDIIEQMKSPEGIIWVKTDKIIYKDKNDNIIGIIGFSVDISKQKQVEEKLQERVEETEKLNKLMIGRELKMVELKQEINKLKSQE